MGGGGAFKFDNLIVSTELGLSKIPEMLRNNQHLYKILHRSDIAERSIVRVCCRALLQNGRSASYSYVTDLYFLIKA